MSRFELRPLNTSFKENIYVYHEPDYKSKYGMKLNFPTLEKAPPIKNVELRGTLPPNPKPSHYPIDDLLPKKYKNGELDIFPLKHGDHSQKMDILYLPKADQILLDTKKQGYKEVATGLGGKWGEGNPNEEGDDLEFEYKTIEGVKSTITDEMKADAKADIEYEDNKIKAKKAREARKPKNVADKLNEIKEKQAMLDEFDALEAVEEYVKQVTKEQIKNNKPAASLALLTAKEKKRVLQNYNKAIESFNNSTDDELIENPERYKKMMKDITDAFNLGVGMNPNTTKTVAAYVKRRKEIDTDYKDMMGHKEYLDHKLAEKERIQREHEEAIEKSLADRRAAKGKTLVNPPPPPPPPPPPSRPATRSGAGASTDPPPPPARMHSPPPARMQTPPTTRSAGASPVKQTPIGKQTGAPDQPAQKKSTPLQQLKAGASALLNMIIPPSHPPVFRGAHAKLQQEAYELGAPADVYSGAGCVDKCRNFIASKKKV